MSFVFLLGLAVFAQGTSEFMLSGLLPGIAADLRVPVSAAGFLTSAFAAGMIVGAPLMATIALRWAKRRALLAFLLTFLAVHVLGALTTSYPVLLVTRFVAAMADAGFLAVATATAAALAPPGAKGRATSVLLGGVTLACVAGVPAGAVLGQLWGWRSAFWAVALACLPAVVAIARTAPPGGEDAPDARGEFAALRKRPLQRVLVLGALINAATFATFTYLAPLAAGRVPLVLALFGVGSFAGVTLGGRLADRRSPALLAAGMVLLLAGWAGFGLTAGNQAALLAGALVLGVLSFGVGSMLIAEAVYAARRAPRLGGAFATSALNVGAAAGPALAGLVLGAGDRAPVWVSATLVAVALVLSRCGDGSG